MAKQNKSGRERSSAEKPKRIMDETETAVSIAMPDEQNKKVVAEAGKNVMNRVRSLYGIPDGSEAGDTVAQSITNSCLEMMMLPKIDTRNGEQVLERTSQYFSICGKYAIKPTIESYGLSLGLSRNALIDIITGRNGRPADVREIIIKAHMAIQAMMAGYMTDNKVNPVAGIFLMKNNMGYSNDDHGMQLAVPDRTDSGNLEEKYEHLLDD